MLADTHDPVRRCSRRRCSGQLVRSGAQRFASIQKRALALRFTDLIHCATLVAVIGAAKGHQGLMYSKVSFIAMKRRRLPTPMWQSMPARRFRLRQIRYFGGTSRQCHDWQIAVSIEPASDPFPRSEAKDRKSRYAECVVHVWHEEQKQKQFLLL